MTNHTPDMVTERHAAGVHHPAIGVTNAVLAETGGLVPGLGHVTQHNIDYSTIRFVALSTEIFLWSAAFVSCQLRLWHLHLQFSFRVSLCLDTLVLMSGRQEVDALFYNSVFVDYALPSVRAAPIAVKDERADFSLDYWGKEVTLDGRNTAWRLGRYHINTNNSATWSDPVRCNLHGYISKYESC